MIIVQKFGGTSVGTSERLFKVAQIIATSFKKNHQIIVVVSAMNPVNKAQGTTNHLLELLHQVANGKNFNSTLKSIKSFHEDVILNSIKTSLEKENCLLFLNNLCFNLKKFLEALSLIKEIPNLAYDQVIKAGEQLSAFILSAILREKNLQSEFLDLSNIIPDKDDSGHPLTNDFFFKEGKIFNQILNKSLYSQISKFLNTPHIIPICTGFIGQFPQGILQVVGRGYTDYTSAILAYLANAEEIQIWKEVNGMFSSNPTLIKGAKLLDYISAKEACELSFTDPEFINPLCMEAINQVGTPIRIKNTFSPSNQGTLICKNILNKELPTIRGIALKNNITIINIQLNQSVKTYSFKSEALKIFEDYKIPIRMITTSEINISISIEGFHEINSAISEKLSQFGIVSIYKNKAIISLAGEKIKEDKSIHSKIFDSLVEHGIEVEMISQPASQINISLVIKNNSAIKAVQLLHHKLIESKEIEVEAQIKQQLASH